MNKLNNKILWLILILSLVIAVALLFIIPNVPGNVSSFLIILVVIFFILPTFCIQALSFKHFTNKSNKNKYIIKEYLMSDELETILADNKFEKRSTSYGDIYLKIDDKTAYKVSIVKDIDTYFNGEPDNNTSSNKKLDKCTSFIAFEVFYDYKNEYASKIVEFSIFGEKIYYTAFVREDNKLICLNYVKPEGVHENNYNSLIKYLNMSEKSEEE